MSEGRLIHDRISHPLGTTIHPSVEARVEYGIGRLRRPSYVVRRLSTISNDFSSKTTGPIAIKFHIQLPGILGKKSCSNGLGHMANMAAMSIYGKNLKKFHLQNQ